MNAALIATHHWAGGPWFPLIPLLFLAFWVTVLVIVGRHWRVSSRRSGEAVLAERYARGEITEEEFRERRQVLRRT